MKRKQLGTGKAEDRQTILVAMNQWLTHDHLAGVRAPDRLALLPKDEQAAWQQLWADVVALRDQAAGPKK